MRVNLLTVGTQGVDMKSNPLFLKNEKLHSAVNVAFEEGIVRTRPRIVYHRLGISGQFQGATLFTPSLGISAEPFAERTSGLVTVAGGRAFINDTTSGPISCPPVEIPCSDGFRCRGEVNVFPAENYLIFQNRESNTHWWKGAGVATASPGMAADDQYWVDPEAPRVFICAPEPVVVDPGCDTFPCDPDPICSLILESKQVQNQTTATFRIKNIGTKNAVISGFTATPSEGVTFEPPALVVLAGASADFTVIVTETDLEEDGIEITVENTCGSGSFDFIIPPPEPPPTNCVLQVGGVVTTSPTQASITILNIGISAVGNININPAGSQAWVMFPPGPYSLAPGTSLTVGIDGAGSGLPGIPFTVNSNCAPPVGGVIPNVVGPSCSVGVDVFPFDVSYAESGAFTVINTGGTSFTITGFEGATTFAPNAPITLDPGQSQFIIAITPGEQIIGKEIAVFNTCLDYSFFLQNDG